MWTTADSNTAITSMPVLLSTEWFRSMTTAGIFMTDLRCIGSRISLISWISGSRLSHISPDGFKYAGMQQKLSLIFSLDKLLNPSNPAGNAVRRNISRRDRRRGTSEYNGPLFGI